MAWLGWLSLGVPALPVGTPKDNQPSQAMDHNVLLD